MYFFSSMKLTLAGQMVEHVNYPDQATSLLGLASYSPEYSKGCGLIKGWTADINANAAVALATAAFALMSAVQPFINPHPFEYTGFAVRQRFLIQSPDPKDSFQCAIPMRHIGHKGNLWDARYIAVDS